MTSNEIGTTSFTPIESKVSKQKFYLLLELTGLDSYFLMSKGGNS